MNYKSIMPYNISDYQTYSQENNDYGDSVENQKDARFHTDEVLDTDPNEIVQYRSEVKNTRIKEENGSNMGRTQQQKQSDLIFMSKRLKQKKKKNRRLTINNHHLLLSSQQQKMDQSIGLVQYSQSLKQNLIQKRQNFLNSNYYQQSGGGYLESQVKALDILFNETLNNKSFEKRKNMTSQKRKTIADNQNSNQAMDINNLFPYLEKNHPSNQENKQIGSVKRHQRLLTQQQQKYHSNDVTSIDIQKNQIGISEDQNLELLKEKLKHTQRMHTAANFNRQIQDQQSQRYSIVTPINNIGPMISKEYVTPRDLANYRVKRNLSIKDSFLQDDREKQVGIEAKHFIKLKDSLRNSDNSSRIKEAEKLLRASIESCKHIKEDKIKSQDCQSQMETIRRNNSQKIIENHNSRYSQMNLSPQQFDQKTIPLKSTNRIFTKTSDNLNTLRNINNSESPNKQIKKEKIVRNLQVEQILYNQQRAQIKTNQNNKDCKPRDIVRQYLKRNHNMGDQIVCLVKTNENHLRRGMERRGWFENRILTSCMFDIKFEVQDQQADYTALRPHQLFNHFPNNTELTTKSGLTKNLYTSQKRIITFQSREVKSNLVLKYIQRYPDDQQIVIKNKMLNKALLFCKQQIRNKNMNDLVKSDLIQEKGDKEDSSVSEKLKRALVKFSQYNQPYQDYPKLRQKMGVSQDWDQPNFYFIYRIQKCHKTLKRNFPQYRVDGVKNVWIVKPSYNARGLGIYCVDNCQDFLQNNQRKVQSKIVQKYIEKPLLLKLPSIHTDKAFERRKFDIRQWVLVNQFDPLEIHVFSDYYLRICGSEFSLNDIQDNFKHLSNFTIQKNNQRVENKDEELAMSQKQFIEYLRAQNYQDVNKIQERIKRDMNKIIIKTIQSVKDQVENRVNCFEIYGFDFILDYQLNPWLLEVNLSPACTERTDWLTVMLDDMTDGLFKILETRLLKINDDYDQDLKARLMQSQLQSQQQKVHTWDLIYKQKEIYQVSNKEQIIISAQQNIYMKDPINQLEIFGKKLNLKIYRKLSRYTKRWLAAIIIQKNYRRYKAKQQFYKLKLRLLVIFIQSFVRMWLAKNKLKYLKQSKAAEKIQQKLRMYIKQKIDKLVKQQILDQQIRFDIDKVIYIQKFYKIRIRKFNQAKQLLNQSAVCIQKHLKSYLSQKKILRQIDIKRKHLIREQLRVRVEQSSLKIQKYLRSHQARKKVQSMKQKRKLTLKFEQKILNWVLKMEQKVQQQCLIIWKFQVKAVVIQKYLRSYREKKKIGILLLKKQQQNRFIGQHLNKLIHEKQKMNLNHNSASLIQRYLKGFIIYKMTKKQLHKQRLSNAQITSLVTDQYNIISDDNNQEILLEVDYLRVPSNQDILNQTFDVKEFQQRVIKPLLSPTLHDLHNMRIHSNKSQSVSNSRPRTPSVYGLKNPSLIDAYAHLKSQQKKIILTNNALIVKQVAKQVQQQIALTKQKNQNFAFVNLNKKNGKTKGKKYKKIKLINQDKGGGFVVNEEQLIQKLNQLYQQRDEKKLIIQSQTPVFSAKGALRTEISPLVGKFKHQQNQSKKVPGELLLSDEQTCKTPSSLNRMIDPKISLSTQPYKNMNFKASSINPLSQSQTKLSQNILGDFKISEFRKDTKQITTLLSGINPQIALSQIKFSKRKSSVNNFGKKVDLNLKETQFSMAKFRKSSQKQTDKKQNDLRKSSKDGGSKYLPYYEQHAGADLYHRYQS
ncbi:tubulin-tyrosine ligase family protein [Stylonychia lemnae]|uniref:Tubulin-tyrosine ligase family protein n=1 Tax=Stylonychia lemnae TaxID=5949 RepID=A0A077ZSC7_STYLE|nr:tubulin-tyrosine ligase family protein [Stylonychia lemnae]|eukprot:CDW71356.1 tubulin-tyrosine ligase family protein [Stylonychia lemnae]